MFRTPILQILAKNRGKGARPNVLKELERVMTGQLTAFDRSDIESGTVRWQKSAEWEIHAMRNDGLLLPRSASPHGVWCLSREGERAVQLLGGKGDHDKS